MAERRKREPIGKKKRFEVFKRDKFTCQYCGRMAPDVVLEVDHIKPVAEGGKNDMLNLITSCRDCNRGKGKTRISDGTEIKKQQKQLVELAERREQTEMLIQWKMELADIRAMQVDYISNYIASETRWRPSDYGKSTISKLISRFSFQEVIEATEISYAKYYDGTEYSWEKALNKIGGVCYNRRMQKNGDL